LRFIRQGVQNLLNWPQGPHGVTFIDFYDKGEHHGLVAIPVPNGFSVKGKTLFGPFGRSEETSIGKGVVMYNFDDWGFADNPRFQHLETIQMLIQKYKQKGMKVVIAGVRTKDGKFWWLYWLFGGAKRFVII
jgi:hypothetical protein